MPIEKFELFSPTDFRYPVEDLKPYLSEGAFIRYKAKVEVALVKILARRGVCSQAIAKETIQAANLVTAAEVYEEERRTRHDIRALVNVIRKRVSDEAKPYVHLLATSYDIIDTANILRYRDAIHKVILPDMVCIEKTWIDLAKSEKDTLQIGRTHGQHAIPITFGFGLAQYISRWGDRIIHLKDASANLLGKFSGAVGAYNSSTLFFDDAEEFEKEILAELGLRPANISTQIVPPEPVADLAHSIISSFGVLANFADDMRHLQRSEIEEIGEPFEEEQIGSSTMPQKRNPINFENVKSMWKAFMPRMITVYNDQISEHQRDLTNSCSQRYIPELLVAFDSSIRRMIKVSQRLRIDKPNMLRNFNLNRDKIVAEPLYVLLALHGHGSAHDCVMKLISESYKTGKSMLELAIEDENLKPYLKRFTNAQREIVQDPSKYVGIASQKAIKVIGFWENQLKGSGLW